MSSSSSIAPPLCSFVVHDPLSFHIMDFASWLLLNPCPFVFSSSSSSPPLLVVPRSESVSNEMFLISGEIHLGFVLLLSYLLSPWLPTFIKNGKKLRSAPTHAYTCNNSPPPPPPNHTVISYWSSHFLKRFPSKK